MTEHNLDKLEVMQKLRSAGVWGQAERYREEVRKRLKSEGKGRAEAVDQAWASTCELFMPLAEASRSSSLEVVLGGDIDEILDSGYAETDVRKRIRDSLYWTAEEFRRIVEDGLTGTVVDFTKATVRPPTVLAIQMTETYAATKEKRAELITKIIGFADRSAAETRFASSDEFAGNSYLDRL